MKSQEYFNEFKKRSYTIFKHPMIGLIILSFGKHKCALNTVYLTVLSNFSID